jgi:D-hydroxyproline dehydrogenase subunit gamma
MFRRLLKPTHAVTIRIDENSVTAAEGDTVAAVLLLAGNPRFRTTSKSGLPRGPYCGMGVCFDCLVTIDGEPNRQACLAKVREGMEVTTGLGSPQLAAGKQP